MPAEYKNLQGTTLTLPARPGLVLTLTNLKLPDLTSTEIPDTDLSSTVMRSVSATIFDAGEVTGTIRYVPGTAIPVGQVDELVRITLPLLTGQSVAGKWEFTGHLTKATAPEASNDGRSTRDITIKVNTLPVFTEGS
jgi:hypothetical protein